jgi:hypothetical protein
MNDTLVPQSMPYADILKQIFIANFGSGLGVVWHLILLLCYAGMKRSKSTGTVGHLDYRYFHHKS